MNKKIMVGVVSIAILGSIVGCGNASSLRGYFSSYDKSVNDVQNNVSTFIAAANSNSSNDMTASLGAVSHDFKDIIDLKAYALPKTVESNLDSTLNDINTLEVTMSFSTAAIAAGVPNYQVETITKLLNTLKGDIFTESQLEKNQG